MYVAIKSGRIETNDPDMNWEVYTRNRNPTGFWIHIAMLMAFFIFMVIMGCATAYIAFTYKANP